MKNQQIAVVFSEIASLLDLRGENPFRIRAYLRAALNIGGLARDVAEMTDEEIRAVPGIGPDLVGKIRQFLGTGRVDLHEDLKKEIPAGLLDILRVPGVGPKTAKTLYEKAGVRTLDDLEALTREGKVAGLPGIQKKTEENIRRGIDTLRKGRERHPLGRAMPVADHIVRTLRAKAPLGRIAVAGSIRRWKETVKDIDILATSVKPAKVMEAFANLPIVQEVLAHGTTKSSILTADGIQVDLRVVEESSFGAALQYLTGSKEHNIKLREMASRAGLKINEYGVFRESDGKRIGGDLHVHTKWSDGAHDLDALVRAARRKGYQYLAITDHSKGLAVARGLDEKRLREQIAQIDEANRTLRGFRILSGVEVDIRGDGTLDLADDVLGELDIVIASIHSGFRQSREQITARLLSAVRNPLVGIIAHPSGRLIGERDPYDVDIDALFREAAARGVAMEVNAYPARLDLSDHHVRIAKRYGIPLVISTDTHVTANFDYMEYGVAVARRGWAVPGDVLNTLPCRSLLKRLRSGRTQGARSGARTLR